MLFLFALSENNRHPPEAAFQGLALMSMVVGAAFFKFLLNSLHLFCIKEQYLLLMSIGYVEFRIYCLKLYHPKDVMQWKNKKGRKQKQEF